MAVFSTNQNRQLYVVQDIVTTEPTKLGEAQLGKTADGKQFFFKYMGHGGLIRTDLIDVANVDYARHTVKEELQTKLKQAVISLDAKLNGGNPIAGQDYLVRIIIKNYLAPGDSSVAIKHGVVHAYNGMTAEDFYKTLAKSLTMNFSKEVVPLLTFEASTTGVTVKEVEQPWVFGTMSQEPVNFEIYATTVKYQGDEVFWASLDNEGKIAITDSTSVIGNGKKMADLEWFCMGERGDQYRMMGYPNVIPTKYMVDPTKEYDVIDIHYSFMDDGVSNFKSEKDITFIVIPEKAEALKTALTGLGITVSSKQVASGLSLRENEDHLEEDIEDVEDDTENQ